jgi:3-(3-hydroxy-phenyl)propionate hydroxylase
MSKISRDHFDAVVVGFGPSGVVATSLLGKAGLSVLAIDRSQSVYDKPRAIALDHEIMRVFQELGVVDKVAPHVAPFPPSEYYGVDGDLIQRIDAVPKPFPLGYTPSLVFSQPPVEAVLRAHAAAYASVEISLGTELVDLLQNNDGVRVQLCNDGRGLHTVTSSYVVGCDGAASTVRRLLGLQLDDLGFDEPWLVIDLLVNDTGLAKLPKVAAQYCNPARPSTFIIGPGQHRRWEIMLLPGEDPRAMEQEPEVWNLLSPWLTRGDATLWRAACYRFHALIAREWRDRRVFIAGDAAHQQPPFIGQGMCQGIRDVVNLVWKINEVHYRRADDSLLDTYGSERAAHVRELTTRIKEIGRIVCERDPTAARARDAKLLAEGGGRVRTITRQEIVPPLRAGLLAHTHHPANGSLFPQPWAATNGGMILSDVIVGGGWRLFLDGRHLRRVEVPAVKRPSLKAVTVCQVDTAHAVADHEPSPITFVETEGVLARWFESHNCVAALVRPDHYVYGVAADAAAAAEMIADVSRRLQ